MKAIVIGAGLAGISTAYFLAERGVKVEVAERSGSYATGASGNAAGIIMPYLSAERSILRDFYIPAADFALKFIRQVEEVSGKKIFSRSGVVQLPVTKPLGKLAEAIRAGEFRETEFRETAEVLDARRSSEAAGVLIEQESIFYRNAGFLSPSELCSVLLKIHAGLIDVTCGFRASRIEDTSAGVRVVCGDSGRALEGDVLVICNAYECEQFARCAGIWPEAVRGQSLIVRSGKAAGALRAVISYDGYITPAAGGEHMLGVTYTHNDMLESERESDSARIIRQLNLRVPSLQVRERDIVSARICFRTSTHDRLPYIGSIRGQKGIYVSAGHGSRGLLSCPFGGSLVAGLICGGADESLAALVDPSRKNFS